jgi:lysophospholipase L1-like esterase
MAEIETSRPAEPLAPRSAAPADEPRVPDPTGVPRAPGGARRRARSAVLVIWLAILLAVVFLGDGVEGAGEELDPGLGRDIVIAVGGPTGWVADRLPFAEATDDALAWLSPGEGGGTTIPATADEGALTLLVTGDSLAMPLDTELARRYAGGDVRVVRDAHVGTGISKEGVVDWERLSTQQARRERPGAVVVFIGANEGFPLPAVGGAGAAQCCGEDWQAAFAARVEAIVRNYARDGRTHVYWLTVPLPRDPARQEITRAVNAAIVDAAAAAGEHVSVLDMVEPFTPGGAYRDAIDVDGREQIVREPDGIHLNGAGAAVAADVVQAAVDADAGG